MSLRRSTPCRAVLLATLGTLCALCSTSPASSQSQGAVCAPVAIPGHYGPYDYVTERGKLNIVEQFHFTPQVEALVRGSSGYLGGDLSYTLNASPNHHRALAAIMKWGAQTKSPQPPHLQFPIDCYFDRAVRFKPKDTVVRSFYAMHLAQTGRREEALRQLAQARDAAPDNALSQYNIGLVYFDLKAYEQALSCAHRARALGHPGSQLTEQLRSVNQWREPVD